MVGHIDEATADIGGAICRTHRHVSLLREYRTSLIADVVTGKLDVREAAAALPELDSYGYRRLTWTTPSTQTPIRTLDELDATLEEAET